MVLDFKEENSVVKSININVKPSAEVAKKVVYDTRNLNLWYGDHHGLKDVNLSIYENEVTAIIGTFGLREIYLFKDVKQNGRASTDSSYIGRNIIP